MAKSKAAAGGQEKKSKIGLIILLAFIGIVVIFVLLTAFNIFGMRDNVVMPILRNVPFVGSFVPDAPPYDESNPLAVANRVEAELRAEIEVLQERINELEEETSDMVGEFTNIVNNAIEDEVELNRLREMEEDQQEFLANREAFERAIIEENMYAFEEWIETAHPDLVERIFTELMAGRIAGEQRQHYINVWGAMPPAAVALAIVSRDMATTEMPLLVSVMRGLPYETAANILAAIPDPVVRGAVMAHMYTP